MTAPGTDARTRLVVLFGGQSAEHDVSRVTARHVLAALDLDRYEIVPIGIDRDGRWLLAEGALAMLGEGGAQASDLPPALAVDGPAIDPLPTLAGPDGRTADRGADPPVVVLPLLHGPMGEDLSLIHI